MAVNVLVANLCDRVPGWAPRLSLLLPGSAAARRHDGIALQSLAREKIKVKNLQYDFHSMHITFAPL